MDLPNNARRLDFHAAKDAGSTAWERASNSDLQDVDGPDQENAFLVQFDGGDAHDVVLVEDQEGHLGACDCDGFAFHGSGDRLEGNVCAHLAIIRQMAVFDESLIPSVDGVLEVGDLDQDESADDQEVEVVDDVQEASADPPDRTDHAEAPTPSEGDGTIDQLDDPFASAIEGVDERFVMELGGDPHIRREGFQRLARAEGYRVKSEMRTWASDTDFEAAEASARVIDEDGDVVATGSATALLEQESLDGAKSNLNELAETRAISRAMGWATGAGISAIEVDASAEYDGEGNSTASAGP